MKKIIKVTHLIGVCIDIVYNNGTSKRILSTEKSYKATLYRLCGAI